jgi:hypothetical protein
MKNALVILELIQKERKKKKRAKLIDAVLQLFTANTETVRVTDVDIQGNVIMIYMRTDNTTIYILIPIKQITGFYFQYRILISTTTCFGSNESSSGVLHKRKLIGTEIICELIVAAFSFYIHFNSIID